MNPAQSNLRGIVAMSGSCLLFVISDLLLKLSSDSLPAGEIVFLRAVFMCALIGGWMAATGRLGTLRPLRRGRVWVRTAGDLVATVSFLPALFNMPLGNVTVMTQMGPLAVAASAAFFLGERVGWRRWAAIIVGFLGVVIVARPGPEGFNAYSLLLLITVGGLCLRDLVTRTLPAGVTGLALIFAVGLGAMPVGLLIGLFEHWVWPGPRALAEVIGSSVMLMGGYYAVIYAVRAGDLSVVSTFRYVVIPYALLAGYLIWGDVPDAPMLAGTAIILGAGLYMVYLERQTARRPRPAR